MQTNQLFMLSDKVIIVTGATGILREFFVSGLSDMGAHVVLLGRNQQVGEERMNELNQGGGSALFIKTDVLSRNELEHARDEGFE